MTEPTRTHQPAAPQPTERFPKVLAAALAGLAIVFAGASARAGHPLETDDTGTQGSGAVEFEVSALAARPAAVESGLSVGLGVALHAGLTESLDLGTTVIWTATARPMGSWGSSMEDPSLDLKWRLSGGGSHRPALAVRLDYAPPQSAVGSHGHDAALLLLSTWERERSASVSGWVGPEGSVLDGSRHSPSPVPTERTEEG